MSSYLVNFARRGDPNACNLPEWYPYKRGDISFNILGDEIVFERLSQEKIKFWQDYYGAIFNF